MRLGGLYPKWDFLMALTLACSTRSSKNVPHEKSPSSFIHLCPKHLAGTLKIQQRLELAQLDHPIGEQANENDNSNGNADDD